MGNNKNRRYDDKSSKSKHLVHAYKEIKEGSGAGIPNSDYNTKVEYHEVESLPSLKVLIICAVCCGLINAVHVSSLFENDRHFSHLSSLEREMTFRTEMGFYYSYYKTIIESDSFVIGLNKLMYDNRTEYPDTINALQRFNIFPEIILGGSYRLFVNVLSSVGIPLPRVCWQVSRGDSLPSVVSCEGIGDPVYWYLSGVWVSSGFTAALIFLSGSQLSNSLTGGFISVLCFFFNHGDATRVQWTPSLRESFAFPFSLALNMIVTYSCRKPKVSWIQPLLFGNLALNYLLCWQFAQFTIVVNISILYFIYTIGLSPPLPLLLAVVGSIYALTNCLIMQFGNPVLLVSPLAGVLIGVLLLYVFIEPILQILPSPSNIGGQLAFFVISSIASKIELSRLMSIEDDEHIVNIFRSKFTNYTDFHTKLYTCSKEFDFLPKETYHKLMETLLIPGVMLVVGAVLSSTFSIIKANLIKRLDEKEEKTPVWKGVDSGVIYNLLLLVAYAIMAALIMRLKLFFTPQLCVVASLLASRVLFKIIKSKTVHISILAVLVSFMCVKGLKNIADQRAIVGEYSDPNLEELLHFIESESGSETSFAGPMSLMASVLLSTSHPIINHPHYENNFLRQRTKAVYSIFSRRTPEEVYDTLLGLKANYIVLHETWCLRRSAAGCGMVDLWDLEEPQNAHKPALCPKLFHHSPSPFHKVFANDDYVVLQVPSKYIEIPAPRVQNS